MPPARDAQNSASVPARDDRPRYVRGSGSFTRSARCREIGSYGLTEKRRQVPGTPLSSYSPRSPKLDLRPGDQVGQVLETSTSPAEAFAATWAPI